MKSTSLPICHDFQEKWKFQDTKSGEQGRAVGQSFYFINRQNRGTGVGNIFGG